ncbi:MAG: DNA-binding transcriptional regulator [Thermoguttaceae bacterium]|nr:DNA-binding transcriptional regulator [Thermoguttaceae bacterium]
MKSQKKVLLIIETTTGFGREIFRGITSYVREKTHWSINIENRGATDPLPVWLADWKGDGIISRSSSASVCQMLRKIGCPLVELYGDNKTIRSEVYCDRHEVARLAARHFVENGFKNIAFYSFGHSWWIRERQYAFAQFLAEHHLDLLLPPDLESNGTTKKSGDRDISPVWDIHSERNLSRWLRSLPKPVGIFAGFDPAAIRIINTCQTLDIRIPEEVAVLGAGNDTFLCEALTPSLSSIDLNPYGIGYHAASLLAERMDKRRRSTTTVPIVLQPFGLVARNSTDILLGKNEDIVRAVGYIRENATRGIKVTDIQNELSISPKTLQRGVKELLGRTPEQEIIRVRIDLARRLLRGSQLSLPEIAARCGFASTKYFINAFRKTCGETPKQYRSGAAQTSPGM